MACPKPLTIQQLEAYPTEATKTIFPDPTLEGYANVAQGRDGPFKLHFITYGHGPNKIIWISGHGAGIEGWADIVKDFGGARNEDKYTSLIFETRGVGQSEAPWSLISMKDLVQDTKDLLDHVGWTERKSINIVGHSMGGMVAIQFATKHPDLLSSLTLISTTTNWLSTISLFSAIKGALSALMPTSADTRLSQTKSQLFSASYLSSPDSTGVFPTNGDAWAAHFIKWPVYYKSGIVTAPACIGHKVSAEECRRVSEALGRGKVLVVHGKEDRMVPVATAERTGREFGGKEMGVRVVLLERAGHMPVQERFEAVVKLVEGMVLGTDCDRDGTERKEEE